VQTLPSVLASRERYDPLADRIHIKVCSQIIEWWDSDANKLRRLNIAKSARDKFRWGRACTPDGTVLYEFIAPGQMGMYEVPINVLLDQEGNPDFNPSRWEQYRTAIRSGRHWMRHGQAGRPIPPDPETVKQEAVRQEQRKQQEERRLMSSPDHFTSYQGNTPKTAREVMALFRKFPRIIDAGMECTIRSVRETFRLGIVLDLHHDKPDGRWIRYKIYGAERKLAEGEILLDHHRGTWVVREQKRRPDWLLTKFGIPI
jgi:hypothetical protein